MSTPQLCTVYRYCYVVRLISFHNGFIDMFLTMTNGFIFLTWYFIGKRWGNVLFERVTTCYFKKNMKLNIEVKHRPLILTLLIPCNKNMYFIYTPNICTHSTHNSTISIPTLWFGDYIIFDNILNTLVCYTALVWRRNRWKVWQN
jgi:hypothetical protein